MENKMLYFRIILSMLFVGNSIACSGENAPLTEFIINAEVTNRQVVNVKVDNTARLIDVELAPNQSRNDVEISLTLNKGVSMVSPATTKSAFNLLMPADVVVAANGKNVTFTVNATSATTDVPPDKLSDIALIYDGGAHRTVVWNEAHFEPYVFYKNDNNQYQWLFDAFLFLEIHDGTHSFATGYQPTPARKIEWTGLIDGYLTKGKDIMALDDCIDNAKRLCSGTPPKRKIIISLPEPIKNQKDWGEINGKAMDFSSDADRIAACQWYIDYVTEQIRKAGLRNIELTGFYWLAEEATNTRTMVKTVADYIHNKYKLKFYWIPYFKSDGYGEWVSLGFDEAFLQPNYFFNLTVPLSRIDEACSLAQERGMSMEMEFDERAVNDDAFAQRMHEYIDGYVTRGVFTKQDVAYYQGGDAWYKLSKGNDNNIALYRKLAAIIAGRHN